MKEERATCPVCGRDVATYVPKQGDGSQRNAYRHLPEGPVLCAVDGIHCAGSNREVPSVSFRGPTHDPARSGGV